jgi:hypothetical protein
MHGETMFFVQLSFLSFIFLLIRHFFCLTELFGLNELICCKDQLLGSTITARISLYSIIFFLILAIEVAFRRYGRAKDYYNSNKSPFYFSKKVAKSHKSVWSKIKSKFKSWLDC